ncbi:hypothetical protein SNOG_06754 [Parastagonospora nodorum SN15]|uniref:CBM1 domain-containing protein n=1 Tax=Phaeosphaeria nodorum (strain SN15 / ATCC MYA-4574 / FGSC 10173) TaxID=321614 RepID=Q0UNB0_PHANO|nr:hypothetical protein SNOG_06754 [Parastagonospora nodorum SN15]EAT85405.1 hypothetical protein SNOG_06754 [Parastagonospora nodorum SN15]
MRLTSFSVLSIFATSIAASGTSKDGKCGGYDGLTCKGSGFGDCCSQWVSLFSTGMDGAALLYTTAQIAVNQSLVTAKETLLHLRHLPRLPPARHHPTADAVMLMARGEVFIAFGRSGETAVLSMDTVGQDRCTVVSNASLSLASATRKLRRRRYRVLQHALQASSDIPQASVHPNNSSAAHPAKTRQPVLVQIFGPMLHCYAEWCIAIRSVAQWRAVSWFLTRESTLGSRTL